MPEQALGELQHEAAVAWRGLSKWRVLKKKRASRISGRGDRGRAHQARCFRGCQRSIRTRIERSEISFSAVHPGQLTYFQRATKVAVGTENPPYEDRLKGIGFSC